MGENIGNDKGGISKLAPSSLEGRKCMEQGLMMAYLLQLNRFALEKELITEDIYRKMEVSIRKQYGLSFQ